MTIIALLFAISDPQWTEQVLDPDAFRLLEPFLVFLVFLVQAQRSLHGDTSRYKVGRP